MFMSVNRAILLVSLLILAGCASGARQGAMVPTVAAGSPVNSKYTSAITVRNVTGGQATNPLWVSKISGEAYKSSLVSALKSNGYYSASGPFQLDVNLIRVQQPLIGASLTVKTTVDYDLKNATGASVFKKTINADYTAKFGDHLMAVERLRLANEGAARENIRLFLAALGSS